MIFRKNFRFEAAEQIKNVINFLHKKSLRCLQKGIENGRHLFMLNPLKLIIEANWWGIFVIHNATCILPNFISLTFLIIRLRIIVFACSLLDLSQRIRGKMISFSFMVENTIIFCTSLDSSCLIDRKLSSRSQATVRLVAYGRWWSLTRSGRIWRLDCNNKWP